MLFPEGFGQIWHRTESTMTPALKQMPPLRYHASNRPADLRLNERHRSQCSGHTVLGQIHILEGSSMFSYQESQRGVQ